MLPCLLKCLRRHCTKLQLPPGSPFPYSFEQPQTSLGSQHIAFKNHGSFQSRRKRFNKHDNLRSHQSQDMTTIRTVLTISHHTAVHGRISVRALTHAPAYCGPTSSYGQARCSVQVRLGPSATCPSKRAAATSSLLREHCRWRCCHCPL